MENLYRYIGLAFFMIIPAGVLWLCASIIYRKIKGKGLFTSGTTFVGEYLIQQWETAGRRDAVIEIQYEREDKRDDAESGDPPDPQRIEPMEQYITEEFSGRIIGAFGQAGKDWLENLPETLESVSERWNLEISPPFLPLSYNYVAPAIDNNNNPVVLKAGVPNNEIKSEIESLKHFNGHGTVRLIDSDSKAGLMLMERIIPGQPLIDIQNDDFATTIFAQVIRSLKKSAPDNHNFPSTNDWSRRFSRLRNQFEGNPGPFPAQIFDRAEKIMSDLHKSSTDPIVLHGDLHHWNILSAGSETWLAIDPKGVVGEKEYEIGAWLRNPYPDILKTANLPKVCARRLDILVDELGYDRDRMAGWAFSQSVLSAIWSFEENSDNWQSELDIAESLLGIL